MSSLRPRTLLITTGDRDGIGLEVAYKALLKFHRPKDTRLVIFEPLKIHPKLVSLRARLLKKFGSRAHEITFLNSNIKNLFSPSSGRERSSGRQPSVIFAGSNLSPATWVEVATKYCLQNDGASLVTGPLSKTLIRKSGLKSIGHTEILKRLARTGDLNMCFLGDRFHVLLATGHVPTSQVSQKITPSTLKRALLRARAISRKIGDRRPIALVGLNPHAGEHGIIGSDEIRVFGPVIRWAKRSKLRVIGPLVPDAAFLRQNWSKYSIFVCPYHDQGLIPFKMIHGADSGAHITLGIPFVRTSVDHGTAKDIFAKNLANPNSMLEALKWALKLG